MLNITNYKRNANQNYNEVPHTFQSDIIKKSSNNKCWTGCGEKGALLCCWWECKLMQPLCRIVWRCLKRLGLKPHDSATQLLHVYPEKTRILKDTCTPMFTAALFTITRTWKQPRSPSTDDECI